jgi:cbb3-type cytochrome oxidase subunit 3
MKLSDVMSAMHFNLFAQIALVIALVGFATVVVSVFLARNREPFRRASLMPLAEDRPAGISGDRA